MSIPSQEERLAFWKFAHARASFVDARIFIELVLKSSLPLNDPVRKALTIAVLTTYARPFKQRPKVQLPRDAVANEYLDLHDNMILRRDKVVAHRDVDAPTADWGTLNQVEFAVDAGGLEVNTESPVILDQTAREILPLLDNLIGKMDEQVNAFVQRHGPDLIGKLGAHVLMTDADPTRWLVRR